MKGYVENVGLVPVYVCKGIVNHGERISFDKLLKKFGDVADTSTEKTFADWLSKNKFVDKNKWKVVINKPKIKTKKTTVENKEPEVKKDLSEKIESKEAEVVSKVTSTNKEIIKKVVTGIPKEITANDIANMSVSEMKKRLLYIDDVKLLKTALKIAERMTQKATLCNGLRDRLTQLSVR